MPIIDWMATIGRMQKERSSLQYQFSSLLEEAGKAVIGPCRVDFESVDYDVSPFDYGRVAVEGEDRFLIFSIDAQRACESGEGAVVSVSAFRKDDGRRGEAIFENIQLSAGDLASARGIADAVSRSLEEAENPGPKM